MRSLVWVLVLLTAASCASTGEQRSGPEWTEVDFGCVQYVGFAVHLEDNLVDVDRDFRQQSWYDAMFECESLMQFTAAGHLVRGDPHFFAVEAVCTDWFAGDDDPFVSRMCDNFDDLCTGGPDLYDGITNECREHFDSALPIVLHADYELVPDSRTGSPDLRGLVAELDLPLFGRSDLP